MSVNNSETSSFVDLSFPAPALAFSVVPKHDVIGQETPLSSIQACVTVNAKELAVDDADQRAPVDIVVAIDVSHSMMGNKLALCKQTLELFLRVLCAKDRFGLVSYATDALVEIPIQNATADMKKMALDKIKTLKVRGSTNISAAVSLAAQEMRRTENPNEVQSIFLLTDGQANVGISDAGGIAEVTKNALIHGKYLFDSRPGISQADGKSDKSGEAAPDAPITMHCFGYGNDHDENLLRGVAGSTPGGTYYFVENDSDVGSAFGDALGGILSVVAQNAVVTIKAPENASQFGVEIADVHHDQKIKRDNGTYTVTLGDFYAEESRDVVFEVVLAKTGNTHVAQPIPHAVVSLSYTDTIKKRPMEDGPVACSISRPQGTALSESRQHVEVQWLRITALNEIAAAQKLGATRDLETARAKIGCAMAHFGNASASAQSHPVAQQMRSELDTMLGGLSNRAAYDNYGSAFIQSSMFQQQQQRCMASEITNDEKLIDNAYRSKNKKHWAKKFNMN